ncbi:hypothetical protein [Kiritimatiella glycovorans]|uniref:Pectate lyase superfamily protein domain-containing protein n=1 Tax=Kiritimatiella glycovorans TaxID=1307763 RepID=A0A0G3EDV4_9BACT|nr:hypothetical protein [Kiritimatiella glycovorans]AKJ63597.1 hypothetical protein L21SP4_00316 [Kiritimatiella glycovorans]
MKTYIRFMLGMMALGVATATAQPEASLFLEQARVYNPIDYGADPSGTEDAAPAFDAMIADLGTNRHVEVFIPPGQYRLNHRVVFTIDGNDSQYGLMIRGGGRDATELLVDNDEGGIYVDGTTAARAHVDLRDLSFVAQRTGIAAAFAFELSDAGNPLCRQLNVENIYITSPKHTSPNYFTCGFSVVNAWEPRFCNIDIRKQGEYADPTIYPVYGIHLEDCVGPLVEDSHINKVQTGIYHGRRESRAGGGMIVNTYLVGCNRSLELQWVNVGDGWEKPQFHVDNCHFNYYEYGVHAVGVRQMHLSHILFYCSERDGSQWFDDGSTPAPGHPTDVNLEYASNITIDHCQFVEPSSPNRRAIAISPNSAYVLIDGNHFNMEGTAVFNESDEGIACINSMFGGTHDFTGGGAWLTRYTNAGDGSMTTDDLN